MSDRRMKVEDIMASTIVPSDQASGLSRACDTGRAARHARGRSDFITLVMPQWQVDRFRNLYFNDVVTRSSGLRRLPPR